MNAHSPRNPTDEESPTARRTVAPFSSRRLRLRLFTDAMVRGGVMVLIAGGVVAAWGIDPRPGAIAAALILVGVLLAWVRISTINARTVRQMDEAAMLGEQDPAAAEDLLARLLSRHGLMRWVRLALHHRVAALRHRQQRLDEAATIARTLADPPIGLAGPMRGGLLLLLCEASLQRGDVQGAYRSLAELAVTPLSLIEQMHRLSMQTRYEVALGCHAAALHDLRRKIALAELMPPTLGAQWHAAVAVAAGQGGLDELAGWLRQRAALLGGA